MKVTSVVAAKKVKEINEKIVEKKNEIAKGSIFRCSLGEVEEDVRPEFDLNKCLDEIDEMELELRELKHKVNVFNANTIVVDDLTIDKVLIRLPQLSERKKLLENLANRLRKQRVEEKYGRSSNIIDYEVINYNLNDVKKELEAVRSELFGLQEKLNYINNTVEFEI